MALINFDLERRVIQNVISGQRGLIALLIVYALLMLLVLDALTFMILMLKAFSSNHQYSECEIERRICNIICKDRLELIETYQNDTSERYVTSLVLLREVKPPIVYSQTK